MLQGWHQSQQGNIDPNYLEEMVIDRAPWRAQCHTAIHSFESSRITVAVDKQRRQKLNTLKISTSSQFMWDACGQPCALRISLKVFPKTDFSCDQYFIIYFIITEFVN